MTQKPDASPIIDRPNGTWGDAVAPLVRKLEVAAAVRQEAVWTADGAAPFAKLLKEMARLLDEDAVEAIRVRDDVIGKISAKNERLLEIGRTAVDAIRELEANHARMIEIVDGLLAESDDEALKAEVQQIKSPTSRS
jgi:hypothetical protein